MIAYAIGSSAQTLEFSDEVLAHFRKHRQTRLWHREAGGQLFARVQTGLISVVEATGPRRTDRRNRTTYFPDRRAEQSEIDERFPAGLHFIGDWHSHPEDRPSPSLIDLDSTGDGVRRSRHSLHGFVMVIVGRIEFPAGLHVAVHDGKEPHLLEPIPTSCGTPAV
jgi:integrative and conjugative element protein (TIGR02256 family)